MSLLACLDGRTQLSEKGSPSTNLTSFLRAFSSSHPVSAGTHCRGAAAEAVSETAQKKQRHEGKQRKAIASLSCNSIPLSDTLRTNARGQMPHGHSVCAHTHAHTQTLPCTDPERAPLAQAPSIQRWRQRDAFIPVKPHPASRAMEPCP